MHAADPDLQDIDVLQTPPPAMSQPRKESKFGVQDHHQAATTAQAEVMHLKMQMQAVESCIAKHAPAEANCEAHQGLSAHAHLRCKHAGQVWYATHLSLRQQLQDATNKLHLQSKSCEELQAELSRSKARQAELESAAQSWQQRAVHAEEELKTERHQIERLKSRLPQQNSVMQANAGQGWAERISGYLGSETQTLAEQNRSLQESVKTLTSQHKSDQQKLADTEQQLAMMKEHAYAASQQVPVKPVHVFNYLGDTESTAVGYPLSGVADLAQDLNKLIRHLLRVLREQEPTLVQVLQKSTTNPWPAVQLQMEQARRESSKTRMLRDGFVHAVLLALESQIWCTDIQEMFCFCFKQQVAQNMHSARLTGATSTEDNPALRNIVNMLDVYTKSCQCWLSEIRKPSNCNVMDALVEQQAFNLFRGLWPTADAQDWKILSPELCGAFCSVARAAVMMRLHVESCHPCFRLSVADSVTNGELCTLPAVIVDSSLTLAASDQTTRIPAETC